MPVRNRALWDSVSSAIGTEAFKAKAVEWIGGAGAAKLAQALLENYGKDGVAFLVDEGGGFVQENGITIATPGIAEKGYLDVRVEVTAPGGHSSVPPKHTHSKELDEDYRTIIKRAATSDKHLRLLEKEIVKNNLYASLVGTTQAVDIIKGGVKANALPERASAVVNHRISTMSSVGEIKAHDTELLSRLAKDFNLTYTAFGKEFFVEGEPSAGKLTLSDAYGTALEPAPVTSTSPDAVPWYILSGTIKGTYDSHRSLTSANEIIVSPGMPSGNTGELYHT
ncbi:hypothetical protein C0993_010792 [Termitomyces sp. T159_Od127]|nr:hypothetical protein C0993_010792 [Termitomyces sp. T159_Od127]